MKAYIISTPRRAANDQTPWVRRL